jgi:hypothetical protein
MSDTQEQARLDVPAPGPGPEGTPADDTPPPAAAFTSPEAAFWACGPGIHALDDPTPFGQENALQRLGKPPFEKSARGRFRLLGYLATVYEHVSQDVAGDAGEGRAAEPRAVEGGASPSAEHD